MIYDFTVTTGKGAQLNLSDYKGKVILVVNTATGCGFTPQYAPIEQLYKDYHDQGLEILDIPCNQFGGQAPGTDDEIHEFCTLHFNTTFPQMKKADVNGENELPLYTYLNPRRASRGSDRIRTKSCLRKCSQRQIRIGTRSRTSSGTLQSSLSIVTARWSQDSSRRRIWLKWRLV